MIENYETLTKLLTNPFSVSAIFVLTIRKFITSGQYFNVIKRNV